MEDFDGKAEEESEENDFDELGVCGLCQREEEAERNGHDDVEDDLAPIVASTEGNVDEGDEIHRTAVMVKNGMIDSGGKRCDNWH